MTRIDSHQHFWELSRGDYTWLTPELNALYRDFLPSDLKPHLTTANVAKSVLVQAAATTAETEFMLNIAERTDFVAGVVGWIDMESDDALANLDKFQQNPYFKGIRPMIQDIGDPLWMLKEQLAPVFEALIEKDLSFDALVTPIHLDALYVLLQRYPKLRVVIDHGGKPDIAKLDIAKNASPQWYEKIAKIAANTTAHCKISGLVTEAGQDPSFEQVAPYMEHLLLCFGAKRLMWGSDWPVLELSSNYPSWTNYLERFLQPLIDDDKQSIWANSARKFYRL